MKKFIAGAIMIANLITISANAAWVFEEKELSKRQYIDVDGDGIIWLYDQTGTGQDMWSTREIYFDMYGRPVDASEVRNAGSYAMDRESFTNNGLTFVEGDKVVDKNGVVLAEGVNISHVKNQTLRVVSENEKYGIMTYDAKMVVPIEYDGVGIYSESIISLSKGETETLYRYDENYNFEKLFVKEAGLRIYDAGKELISVKNENGLCALMDCEGKYLTDFMDKSIYIYENSRDWQAGDFACLSKNWDKKYINQQLQEIDIYSQDSIYCTSFYEFSGTALINNGDYYALYDTVNKEFIIPYSQNKLTKCNNLLLFNSEGKTYVLNQYGEKQFCFDERVDSMSEFSEGVAIVKGSGGEWACDTQGENIFSQKYSYVYRVDNNEFLVQEGFDKMAKILVAQGITGEALYTDVKININGVEIPCYSAYGYAVIKAEDLRNFGFDVRWESGERMLYVSRNPKYYNIVDASFPDGGVPGTHFSDIYGSDINVDYNGRHLSSYCINGETLIKPEELAGEGISFNYDDSVRTLYMNVDGLERR